MSKFVHLHVHTHYSLLDGACKVPDLVKRVKSLGMDACAITDHGCMFGVIEFFNECKKEGIKPILGMEGYMAPGDRRDRQSVNGEAAYHLLLLAQDLDGYKNLMKLASIAYREGFYYKPRIDKEVLREFSKGLIATSACLGGEVCSAFMKRDQKAARHVAETYADIFGPDRFFIEVQKQGLKEQDMVNPELVDLANKLGVGLVATNDVHFLNKDDYHAHDILCCISMGRLVSDENRLKYPTELYLKSPEEMASANTGEAPLTAWQQAMENTAAIAGMCDLSLDFSKRYAPVYRVPREKIQELPLPSAPKAVAEMADDERYLRELCEKGLQWRYGTTDVPKEIRERLEYELKVIIAKSFCSYFLIVWDFCNYARDHGIPVGARGSGVGTMVGYLLGLCNVDPIRYNLLFERFMDPSRSEMPDIDIDICQDGRQKVIEYVRNKYGHVAQIITFGTMAAKAACKDVGRVLGVPLPEIDRLTKLIPGTPGMTLKKALDSQPELLELYNTNPTIQQVIDLAKKLEGTCRNAGCHAAGVIIADIPLDTVVPLYKDKDDNILTQFEGPIAEKVGLLKMDFLGLRTLTVLTRSVDLESQTRPQRGGESALSTQHPALPHPRPPVPTDDKGRIDLEKIDLTDKNVFALFCRGDTRGVFQFESGGMQDLLMKMQPDRVEDLIAANALYRPGPMELIPLYCNRKHGREKVPEVHPIMDKILEETYGIMVYQEQVMQIFNQLGGIELANAYKLIKAISKKNIDIIAKFRPDFIKGTMSKGVSQEKAEEIFELILKFGGYGFNKCVVGATRIVDARTGEITTVEALFNNRREFLIHSVDADGKLHPRSVSDVIWNGAKPVFELTTAQGRKIVATSNHPFMTLDGWTELSRLKVGDRIASPRRLEIKTDRSWPRHELVTLAGLIAEGNTCHPTCLYFFGNDPALVADFAEAASQFPHSVARIYSRDERRMEVCVSTGQDARFRPRSAMQPDERTSALATPPCRSGAYRWAESLGLLGKKATVKFIPAPIFQLCDGDIELFLGRLWAGDGFIANKNQFVPYYATSSPQLAGDVQLLLLRLGILSGVHAKSFKYKGTLRPGYTVHLLGEGSIHTFLNRVTPHCLGREAQVELLRIYLPEQTSRLSSKDTIPPEIRTWVDEERRKAGLTWRQLEDAADVSMKEFVGNGSHVKRGFRRSTIARLAAFFSSKRLSAAAESDIFWDRIVSIEPKGIADTYDLTVETDHNFVADGLIVHNSHSTRYAVVAFQTAYMKVYHPPEYMAALLTYEMGNTDKMVEYIDECRRVPLPDGGKGIKVLPPDVNISDKDFTPVYQAPEEPPTRKKSKARSPRPLEGVIRFGLMAVRGVGEKAVETIIHERKEKGPYPSLYEFCERVDLRAVTKSTIEALIKCGAFSSLNAKRAQLLQVAEKAVEMGQQTQNDKRNGQLNMFAALTSPAAGPAKAPLAALPDIEELPPNDLLKLEKELLGFYISSHPLTEHQTAIANFSTHSTKEAMACSEGTEVVIGGMISRVKKVVTKNGRSAGMQMAIVTLEDLDGPIDGTLFAESLAANNEKYPTAIANESIVFVRGKVDKKRETPSLIVDEVIPVSEATPRLTTSFVLRLSPMRHQPDLLVELKAILKKHAGNKPVFAQVSVSEAQSLILQLGREHSIKPTRALLDDVELLLGPGAGEFKGAGSRRARRAAQQPLFQAAVETQAAPHPEAEMEPAMPERDD